MSAAMHDGISRAHTKKDYSFGSPGNRYAKQLKLIVNTTHRSPLFCSIELASSTVKDSVSNYLSMAEI